MAATLKSSILGYTKYKSPISLHFSITNCPTRKNNTLFLHTMLHPAKRKDQRSKVPGDTKTNTEVVRENGEVPEYG